MYVDYLGASIAILTSLNWSQLSSLDSVVEKVLPKIDYCNALCINPPKRVEADLSLRDLFGQLIEILRVKKAEILLYRTKLLKAKLFVAFRVEVSRYLSSIENDPTWVFYSSLLELNPQLELVLAVLISKR